MYQIERLMLFSPDVFRAVVASYNQASWLLSALASFACLIALVQVARGRGPRVSIAYTVLAGTWLWVGYVFHAGYYATINWAAGGFAVLFLLQGVWLMRYAWTRPPTERIRLAAGRELLGMGWLTLALLHGPVQVLTGGLAPAEAAFFGTAPQTVVWSTLGLIMLTPGKPWLLLAPVLAAALVEATTALLLGDTLTLGVWALFAATFVVYPCALLVPHVRGRQP